MREKTKHFFCILTITLSIGFSSDLLAQPLTRLFGADGLVLDSRAKPYQAVTLYVPTNLISSYSLAFPSAPPPGPTSILASDVNGLLSWVSASGMLPSLPPNNIWVGNALSVATPYAPTVAGAVLTLDSSLKPIWSDTIIANNLSGAGVGKYAGNVTIPQNAATMAISYPGIKSGAAAVSLSINDPNLPGVAVYLQNITPGVGFTVAFSANYPTNTGVVTYLVINP